MGGSFQGVAPQGRPGPFRLPGSVTAAWVTPTLGCEALAVAGWQAPARERG